MLQADVSAKLSHSFSTTNIEIQYVILYKDLQIIREKSERAYETFHLEYVGILIFMDYIRISIGTIMVLRVSRSVSEESHRYTRRKYIFP